MIHLPVVKEEILSFHSPHATKLPLSLLVQSPSSVCILGGKPLSCPDQDLEREAIRSVHTDVTHTCTVAHAPTRTFRFQPFLKARVLGSRCVQQTVLLLWCKG